MEAQKLISISLHPFLFSKRSMSKFDLYGLGTNGILEEKREGGGGFETLLIAFFLHVRRPYSQGEHCFSSDHF